MGGWYPLGLAPLSGVKLCVERCSLTSDDLIDLIDLARTPRNVHHRLIR